MLIYSLEIIHSMNWFILSLIAALFFSCQRIAARFLLRKQGDPISFTIIHNLIAGLILSPIFFFVDLHLPAMPKTWILYICAVFFYGVGDVYTYKAIKELSISTWQIITQVRHIFVLLGGFLVYAEPLTSLKILGIFLIILGAIVALYHKERKKMNLSVGVFFTILAAFLISAGVLVDKTIIQDFSMPLYVSLNLMTISMGGIIYFAFNNKMKCIINEFKIQKYGLIFTAILFGLHKIFLILAINNGEVSRVIPISQAALIFTVIAGILFLKEYERMLQKIIGVIIMILGIGALYFL